MYDLGKKIKSRLLVVMTWWALVLYPFLAETILSSMFCFQSARANKDPDYPNDPTKFKVEEVYRLKVVPEIVCYDRTHFPIMLIFGLIPMCFYLIYIPFKTARDMKNNEQRLTLDLKEVPNLQRLRVAT